MPNKGIPRILVWINEPADLAEFRQIYPPSGYEIVGHPHQEANSQDPLTFQLVVIDGKQGERSLSFCRQVRTRFEHPFVPILFLGDTSLETRQKALEAGADTYLSRPWTHADLLAQSQSLLRIKEGYDHHAKNAPELHRINKRLGQAYQQMDQELELARQIQPTLLPNQLPQMPQVQWAVHYRPNGRVGGDFFDVFYLDEKHVGFYVADAMGHGVLASLVTIFAQKRLCGKKGLGKEQLLLSPEAVLNQLNRDLLNLNLRETPFLSMLYGLFHHLEGTLWISRAGHPCPLFIPATGPMEVWRQEGLLLGIAEAHFNSSTYSLKKGDKLLFRTDGMDTGRSPELAPGEGLLACAERHRSLPIQALVDQVAEELLGGQTGQVDDITFLGLEYLG